MLSDEILVKVIDDVLEELDETLIVDVWPRVRGVGPDVMRSYSITSQDVQSIGFIDRNVVATSEAGVSFALWLELAVPAPKALSVPLVFAGSARFGVDYTVSSQNIAIPAGGQVGSTVIALVNDQERELRESIVVSFVPPEGWRPADYKSFTMIIDDLGENATPAPSGQIVVPMIEPEPPAGPLHPDGNDNTILVNPPGTIVIGSGSQLAGGLIFFDRNRNLIFDPGEASGVTDLEGRVLLPPIPNSGDTNRSGIIDAWDGQWVLVAGRDSATANSLEGPLIAPMGMYVVSPLCSRSHCIWFCVYRFQRGLLSIEFFGDVDIDGRPCIRNFWRHLRANGMFRQRAISLRISCLKSA